MATALFPPGSEDVLYVVDLSSYMLRAYHAVAELSSPSGEPTHAVLGVVNMLDRLVRTQRPKLFAIALDSGRDTFRKELYPEYKAHRPSAPPDLKQQIARCYEIVRARGYPIFQQKGAEADDVIATLVEHAKDRGLRVVIVAADKDLMQLVSDRVLMWDTMRNKVFGAPEVQERFGVPVSALGDLLALTGDTSDNVPGVPHVGPKTARDLLLAYGDLDGIYRHAGEIKSKSVRETLLAHQDQAFLSRKLVTLKKDCPFDLSVPALTFLPPNEGELSRLYRELGFQRQLELLGERGASRQASEADASPQISPAVPNENAQSELPLEAPFAPAASGFSPAITIIFGLAELEELLQLAKRQQILAVDTFADVNAREPELVGIGLAAGLDRAFYLPLSHRYLGAPRPANPDELLEALGAVLADPAIKKVGYDLKRSRVEAAARGLELVGFAADPMLMAYLLDPESNRSLEALAESELGLMLTPLEQLLHPARGQRLSPSDLTVERAAEALGLRVTASLGLAERLGGRLEEIGLAAVFRDMELPLAHMLADLERTGVLVDVRELAELSQRCGVEIARLEGQAHKLAGREFNVNSPRQLETILFDECGLKSQKRTKTARSTDHETLEALAEAHELPRVILELRQYVKLKGTYLDALPLLVRPSTGRVHTRWQQAVAATGRLSSTDPNLQNIPIRTELGRSIRGAFTAPPGHLLISADYSQIELRVLAHLSRDPLLIEAFQSGADIHSRTAMEIFGVPESGVTRELRTRAKAVNFGVIYGQGDSGLAKSLGISRDEAGQFIAAYFRRYEGVRAFMNETLERARSGEAVRSLFGRQRLVPEIGSANRARRLAAERIAMNMPIQGTAADILKLAMLAFGRAPNNGLRMILTVHDELVFEVPEAEAEAVSPWIKSTMQKVCELLVPLVVDVGRGKNWRDAH